MTRPMVDIIIILAPISVDMINPIGLVREMHIRKCLNDILLKPQTMQSASSGKNGSRNIAHKINLRLSLDTSKYFSRVFKPTNQELNNLPKTLANINAQIEPNKIAAVEMIKPFQNPNIIPPARVVMLPGMGEIITCTNCSMPNITGAFVPKDNI